MSELNLTHSNGNKVKLTTPDSLAANKTFKLPSADGSAYSPIITDGSGALSFSSLKLPSSDGSSGQAIVTNGSNTLSFATVATTNGITMADQWMLTSSFSPGGAVSIVTSGWGQVSRAGYGIIGSSMTQSSGVFTYPQTGIYFVEYTAQLISTSTQRYMGQRIQTTHNNSSYAHATDVNTHCGIANSYGTYMQATSSVIQDVQDVTQDKVRFCVSAFTPGDTTLEGDSSRAATHVTFIRLGDT